MNNEKIIKKPPIAGKIKRCRASEKHEGEYVMTCRIHQRGEHIYYYTRGSGRLIKTSGKELLLDDEGVSAVENAADIFDMLEAAMKNPSDNNIIKACFDELGIVLYLKHSGKEEYDILFELWEGSCAIQTVYIPDIPGCNILHKAMHHSSLLFFTSSDSKYEKADKLFNPGPDNLTSNPLYMSAVKQGDKQLKAELELYYGLADAETVHYLRKTLGHYYLLHLPEEYDQTYVVKADPVLEKMLTRSGYRILHRPYFAMRGSTHESWGLNPHTKTGVDASSSDAKPLSSSEFLKMFNYNDKT